LSVFFFQAEDGIRDFHVTGVQTCALPISRYLVTPGLRPRVSEEAARLGVPTVLGALTPTEVADAIDFGAAAVKVFPASRMGPSRSEERRVGREGRARRRVGTWGEDGEYVS